MNPNRLMQDPFTKQNEPPSRMAQLFRQMVGWDALRLCLSLPPGAGQKAACPHTGEGQGGRCRYVCLRESDGEGKLCRLLPVARLTSEHIHLHRHRATVY